jgi:hypothetical protein
VAADRETLAPYPVSNDPTEKRGGCGMGKWFASMLCLLLLARPAFSSGHRWTDAENLGLAGPVQSVTTTHQAFMPEPAQPDGPTIVYPLSCEYCEFDRDGTRVRDGGIRKRRVLDAQGRVEEDITENEKGEVTQRDVYANRSFGKVRSETWMDGKLLSSATFDYDGQGNMVEWDTYKADGTLEARTWSRFDGRGNEIEQVSEGPGEIYYDVIKTYDPRTGHQESFASLDRDGSLRLSMTMDDRTVLSYWQRPGDKRTYGSDVCFADDDGTERDCRDYKSDGSYSTAHYNFTDKTKRNPVKAVLRDPDGQRLMEADYDYALDQYGNWTSRTVWVWTRESGERRLLEKDSRTLTYYPAE